jgi:hypothetical protein
MDFSESASHVSRAIALSAIIICFFFSEGAMRRGHVYLPGEEVLDVMAHWHQRHGQRFFLWVVASGTVGAHARSVTGS